MDSDHRVMLDWVQESTKRLLEAHPMEETLYAVDVLAHLACSHFEQEQIEMRAQRYPHRFAHGPDHERLLAQLAQLRQDILKAAAGTTPWPAHERLAAWLLSYIAGHDQDYARWQRQRGSIATAASLP